MLLFLLLTGFAWLVGLWALHQGFLGAPEAEETATGLRLRTDQAFSNAAATPDSIPGAPRPRPTVVPQRPPLPAPGLAVFS